MWWCELGGQEEHWREGVVAAAAIFCGLLMATVSLLEGLGASQIRGIPLEVPTTRIAG